MPRSFKITLHLFFRCIYCLFAAQLSFKLEEGTVYLSRHIDIFTINFIWASLAFYVTYLWVFNFFEQKRYTQYFITTIAISCLFTLVFAIIYRTFYSHIRFVTSKELYTSLPGTFIIANCGSLLKGFVSWFDTIQQKNELEKQSLQYELDSLKSQINPHFLFNTLNNIDSLIHISHQKASNALLKLSDILRYMLYKTTDKQVPISDEIQQINNILCLHKLRYENDNQIVFEHNITSQEIKIPPLLFTSFIENAVKFHNKDNNTPINVNISISNNNTLNFFCSNSYLENTTPNNEQTGGIGLYNVKRRLQLHYPNKHTLLINSKNHTFEVQLTINLE